MIPLHLTKIVLLGLEQNDYDFEYKKVIFFTKSQLSQNIA